MKYIFCKQCGNEISEDGTHHFCSKECAYEYGKKMTIQRNKNSENFKGYSEGLVKGVCDICKNEFNKNNKVHKYCSKECVKIAAEKRWDLINRGIYNKNSKSYNYYKLRFEVFKRNNFTCQYCGRNVKDDGVKLHCDHIIPKNKGGENTDSNLITSCEECNLGKGDCLLEEKRMEVENEI